MNYISQFQTARSNPDLVVLEGFHAIKHALRFGANIQLCAAKEGSDFQTMIQTHAPDLTNQFSKITTLVDAHTFTQLTPHPPETGIIAIASRPHYTLADMEKSDDPIVLLDHPTHPGNVGACIRVCAAGSCAGLIVLGDIDPWSPPCIRGSAGLGFALPVLQVSALSKSRRSLIAFDERGEKLDASVTLKNCIAVFGSERHGISDALRRKAEKIIAIPMRDGVSSLNLATTVAIAVYHTRA